MKKNTIIVGLVIFFLLIVTSGCIENLFQTDDDGSITYQSHAVRISYTISYGYDVNCVGNGEFNIKYDCDIPELLNDDGSVSNIYVFDQSFDDVKLVNNSMKSWDITSHETNSYKLGLKANVVAESFIVADVTGRNALLISEIKEDEKDIFDRYTKSQYLDDVAYIDPDHTAIRQIAEEILGSSDTDNSFIVAKEIFLWLKHNTQYQVHNDRGDVQPASITYNIESGDCDDLSFLYISLLRAVDIPARFIRGFLVEQNNAGQASATAHAWVEVFVGGNIGVDGWIPVECACPSTDNDVQIYQNFGVESTNHLRLFKDEGTNQSLNISISSIRAQYENGITIDMQPIADVDNYVEIESKELYIKDNYRRYK